MTAVTFTLNGRTVTQNVEPRTHLADLLREQLNLTATHLRCEQGVCGACTLLIDGQPARSCITYAVLCDGAVITSIEGLQDDPAMVALRRAFSLDHGLQCGYCTPGMLMTARDIVMRLPDADAARIRTEISGNLCRCTGYVGIVNAISRVLKQQRDGELTGVMRDAGRLGPVGARPAAAKATAPAAAIAPSAQPSAPATAGALGLAGRKPNFEITQSFTVSPPPDEVWAFFADLARVVPCLPGASLTKPPEGDRVEGKMSVKLGPIVAKFAGQARIVRDDSARRGVILGAGTDQLGGSRAAGEAEYVLEPAQDAGTRVALTIRAQLSGPLAQFGRSGIVEDLVARITGKFAQNLETRLSGTASADDDTQAPLAAGGLLWRVALARLKSMLAGVFGSPRP